MNHFLYGRTRDVFVLTLFWFTVSRWRWLEAAGDCAVADCHSRARR